MISLSVVIPVYNSEKYLSRCIESVLRQLSEDIELILVDDGSSDNSPNICDSYLDQNSNIRVIHKENQGQTSARKAGVKVSRGKWISFVDSDDYIDDGMFRRLLEVGEKYECDLVSTGIKRDFENDGYTIEVLDNYCDGFYPDIVKSIYPTMLYDFNRNDFGLYCNLVTKLFKQEVLNDVLEGMDSEIFYGEDAAVLYSYCMKIKNVYILHESFYHYCIRQGSMSRDNDNKLSWNTYKLYEQLKNSFAYSTERNVLMKQLKRYILDVELHSVELLYGINHALFDDWVFTFDESYFMKPYVLYGAGACGQALYHQLRNKGLDQNLVAWVDQNFFRAREECDYPVESIKNGLSNTHNYVILAVKNDALADSIRDILIREYDEISGNIIWSDVKEISRLSEMIR